MIIIGTAEPSYDRRGAQKCNDLEQAIAYNRYVGRKTMVMIGC